LLPPCFFAAGLLTTAWVALPYGETTRYPALIRFSQNGALSTSFFTPPQKHPLRDPFFPCPWKAATTFPVTSPPLPFRSGHQNYGPHQHPSPFILSALFPCCYARPPPPCLVFSRLLSRFSPNGVSVTCSSPQPLPHVTIRNYSHQFSFLLSFEGTFRSRPPVFFFLRFPFSLFKFPIFLFFCYCTPFEFECTSSQCATRLSLAFPFFPSCTPLFLFPRLFSLDLESSPHCSDGRNPFVVGVPAHVLNQVLVPVLFASLPLSPLHPFCIDVPPVTSSPTLLPSNSSACHCFFPTTPPPPHCPFW